MMTDKMGLSSQKSQTADPSAPTEPILLTAPSARSLSPIVIRRKTRNKDLSPMSKSFKKTLHVSISYDFI
jgi:hypothetical protein